MKLKPKKVVWRMCRCKKRPAVIGPRCGHCYAAMVDRFEKKSRNSRLMIGCRV